MDLEANGRRFHLPAELIDLIIHELRGDLSDIRNVRLACRNFARSATPYIHDIFESPSPLLPTRGNESGQKASDTWPLADPPGHTSVRVLTSLTCCPLRKLDDSEMLRLRGLIWAPHEFVETDRRSATDGRLATFWGVTEEVPPKLWLIHQWPSKEVYHGYCQGRYAVDLARYLEEVAPGCLLRSSTKFCTLPIPRRRQDAFASGYSELRTLYFSSDMSYEQRRAFEKDMHVDPQMRERNAPLPFRTNSFYIYWIQGLRSYKRNSAVAARLIISWESAEEPEALLQAVKDGETWQLGLGAVLEEESLEPFGILGIESERGIFASGPFA